MNKELYNILEDVKGLEDTFQWMKAVIHLDKRIINLEDGLKKTVRIFDQIIFLLEEQRDEISKIH